MRKATAGIALLAVCGCSGNPDVASRTGTPTKLRVALSIHLSWGPLMIAQEEGFFRDEGIEVEFVTAQRPDETLVGLVTGDLDVRPGPLSAGFLSAIAQGAPIKMVAGQGNLVPNTCTYYGIVLRKGLDTAGTPNIRRIRASQDGATRFVVNHMLASRKMDIDDVETIRIPESVMQVALENGSLDAVAVSEPALTRLKKVGTMWMSGEDHVPDFQWAAIAFGERLLTRDRDAGMRFIRAYQRGVEQYRQGKTDRNVEIISRATFETPEHTREVCWPAFAADSRINWESIAAFQTWANAEGIMERSVTRDQAFDSLFITAHQHTVRAGTP
jgi:NitT/TauT family transport system substrate-binding protein